MELEKLPEEHQTYEGASLQFDHRATFTDKACVIQIRNIHPRKTGIAEIDETNEFSLKHKPYVTLWDEIPSLTEQYMRPAAIQAAASLLRTIWRQAEQLRWGKEIERLQQVVSQEVKNKFGVSMKFLEDTDLDYGMIKLGNYYKQAHALAKDNTDGTMIAMQMSDHDKGYTPFSACAVPYVIINGKPVLTSLEHVHDDLGFESKTTLKCSIEIGRDGYQVTTSTYRFSSPHYICGLSLPGHDSTIENNCRSRSSKSATIPYTLEPRSSIGKYPESAHAVDIEFAFLCNMICLRQGPDAVPNEFSSPKSKELMWKILEKDTPDLELLKQSFQELHNIRNKQFCRFRETTKNLAKILSADDLDYQRIIRVLDRTQELFKENSLLSQYSRQLMNVQKMADIAVRPEISCTTTLQCEHCRTINSWKEDQEIGIASLCTCGARSRETPFLNTTVHIQVQA